MVAQQPKAKSRKSAKYSPEPLFTRRRLMWTVIVLVVFVLLGITGVIGQRTGTMTLPDPQSFQIPFISS